MIREKERGQTSTSCLNSPLSKQDLDSCIDGIPWKSLLQCGSYETLNESLRSRDADELFSQRLHLFPTLVFQNGGQVAAHPQHPESPDAEAKTRLLLRQHHQRGGDGLHRQSGLAQGEPWRGGDGQRRGWRALQVCFWRSASLKIPMVQIPSSLCLIVLALPL